MVRKLLKQEIIYYYRKLCIFIPIVFAFGLFVRLFVAICGDNTIGKIIVGLSYTTLAIACIGLIFLSAILGIVRFYKNMYSSEGYLTLTLPVKHSEHILVKLIGSTAAELICLLVVIITILFSIPTDLLGEFFLSVKMHLQSQTTFSGVNGVLFVIEMFILLVAEVASGRLLIYACITVGQLAKRNRVLMAVVAYFVYYVASQIVSAIFAVISTLTSFTGLFDNISAWLDNNAVLALHLTSIGGLLLSAALGAAYWFVTQYIMSKKLNLE